MSQNLPRTLAGLAAFALLGFSAGQGIPNVPYLNVPQRCAFVVANPFLVKKLELTPTQGKAVNQVLAQYAKQSAKISSEKAPTAKEKEANDKQFTNACLKILTPVQFHKILQLGVQQIGTRALTDSEVGVTVGLTTAQGLKIKEIYRDFDKREDDVNAMVGAALEAIPEPKEGADRTAYDKKYKETNAMYEGERQRIAREKVAAEKKVVGLLTPEQREKWMKLAGPAPKK